MQKPKKIQELEHLLGSTLKEAKDTKSIYLSGYVLNEDREIIALSVNKTIIKDSIWAKLNAIESLQLYYCETNDIDFVKKLPNLKNLSIVGGNVSDISNLSFLPNLELLMLMHSKISNLEVLKQMSQIKVLSLMFNKIRDVSNVLYLLNLEFINFSGNFISEVNIHGLVQLKELNLMFCRIDTIKLQNLPNLKELDLSINNITSINDIGFLPLLEILNLSENRIEEFSLSHFMQFPLLKHIELTHNNIKNIPVEIFGKGGNRISEIHDFLIDKEKGGQQNKEIKIILIGNGSVGKTQIVKRLVEKEFYQFENEHKSTHGIDLYKTEINGISFNIWDLAGQDIYHATHRLFMQTRALFVLVWDFENESSLYHEHNGTQYKNEKLLYWLEYASHFGKGSPILIVQNKVDTEEQRQYTNLEKTEAYYESLYPIVKFMQCSAKTGYNFDVLEYWIVQSIENNESLKVALDIPFPISWLKVRDQIQMIRQGGQKQMTVDFFDVLCESVGIKESSDTLLQYLHDSSFLFYKSNYFSNSIIIDQSWAIDAVYKILDRQGFYFRIGKIKKGRLTYQDLQELWKENTDEERELFINFMLSAELAFQLEQEPTFSKKVFIVPQLLPENKPTEIEFWKSHYSLIISDAMSYSFLPTIFIQRFLVKSHGFFNIENIWQHGAFLEYENCYALVEADYDDNKINIISNDYMFIEKIKEELDIINDDSSNNVNNAKNFLNQGVDIIGLNGQYIKGLAGLPKDISAGNSKEEKINSPKKKILFVAACARNTQQLAFAEEHRVLKEEMRSGKQRDDYEWMEPVLAATLRELMRALSQKPNLIHFSGHGVAEGIYLETEAGQAQLLTNELLTELFKSHKENLRLIFLNSCYSEAQAALLSQYAGFVVGHQLAIGDKAAIAFAKGFYLTLSEGASIKEAVSNGKIMAMSEGRSIVVVLWKDGQKLP